MARSPVYTSLRDSPYEYMFGNVRFKFSSALHRAKFSKGLAQRIAWLNDSMSRRFKCLVDFRLMAGAAFVVHGHVVGVGVIITVCNARQAAELLAVYTCELARQPFGRRGQYAVIMLVLVGELVGTVAHVSHDF